MEALKPDALAHLKRWADTYVGTGLQKILHQLRQRCEDLHDALTSVK